MLGAYKKQSLSAGWTRVEMLLQIYDRAIMSLEGCVQATTDGDQLRLAKHFLDAQKALLAIHLGLKTDESEVASNIERLLLFVLTSIENKDYPTAINILKQLRDGFAAVTEEANLLEHAGAIPPMPASDTYESTA